MNITIRKAELADLDLLMKWRMTVLREVFSAPQDDPMTELEQETAATISAPCRPGAMSPVLLVPVRRSSAAAVSAFIRRCPRRTTRRATAPI